MASLFSNGLVLSDMQKLEALRFNAPVDTKESYQNYCLLIKYLELLAEGGLVFFPLTISKTAGPDFILRTQGKTIGLEQMIAQATAYGHPMQDGVVTHPLYEPQVSSIRGMGYLDRVISGHGAAKEAPQQEWVSIITDSIQRKVLKLQSGVLNEADELELLIYDNTYVSVFIEPDEARCNLNTELQKRGIAQSGFTRISIITQNKLLYDVENCRLTVTKY